MKKLVMFLLTLFLLTILTSCNDDNDDDNDDKTTSDASSLTGYWIMTEDSDSGPWPSDYTLVQHFDGTNWRTYDIDGSDITYDSDWDLPYSFDGQNLYSGGEFICKITISGSTMKMIDPDDGYTETYSKSTSTVIAGAIETDWDKKKNKTHSQLKFHTP
ncbi:MAG: hypothetical protein JXK07_08510 [Spirochaetes bacterium]|nr:hypothetical protein [Spirochaetota bacterium]MBN2770954.1 hypothetical protein [Spirochaetota bacterium]